jgi:hypothetical protein
MNKLNDRQMERRLYRGAEKWSSARPGSTPHTQKVVMQMVQKSFYYINRIVSTFNRIESLGQLLLVFLIEIYLNNLFIIVIVSTSIRLKKIGNCNPLYVTLRFCNLLWGVDNKSNLCQTSPAVKVSLKGWLTLKRY